MPFTAWHPVSVFDHILLMPEQEELLARMVEAARSLPVDQREKFMLLETNGGDFLIHHGLPGRQVQVVAEDVQTLNSAGLLAVAYGSRGTPNYNVTPLGHRYYEHLKTRGAAPAEQVEREVRGLIESSGFAERYPEAHRKWVAAASVLWHADSDREATTIGHHCREAIQAFATHLIEQFEPADTDPNLAHDVNRIAAVLESTRSKLGASEHALLEALLGYWKATSGLAQRQVHAAQREGERLVWEDSRRLVFQTAVLMYELDRSLARMRQA